MEAVFYWNKSDPNHINKNLSELGRLSINLKEATSILNPELVVSSDLDWISTCNYLYIPQLKRYYYITSLDSVRNGLWSIKCHIDVLQSYRPYILQQEGVIARQEFNYNILLDDGTLLSYANPDVITKKFPKSFNSDKFSYVLVGVGGK